MLYFFKISYHLDNYVSSYIMTSLSLDDKLFGLLQIK